MADRTRALSEEKMNDYKEINADEVWFVSDAHFKSPDAPGEMERRERFLSFLGRIPRRSALVLLGDIFDFYFEYRTTVPKHYFDIFRGLHDCRGQGVDVHFLGGNHDCWTRNFFTDELGITVHKREIRFACRERKILCVHGDLTLPGDTGYKVLRAIIQNGAVIAAASLLHPDILESIAAFVAKMSKSQQRESHESAARKLGASAGERFFLRGNDAFIMGHIHFPHHSRHDGRDFLILGGWLEHFTYARLVNGKITLEKFTG